MSEDKNATQETSRLEFFSDGVFAIAITLLIIEIKVPTEAEAHAGLYLALIAKWPSYLAFAIGFVTTLVCWINHHFIFSYIVRTSPAFNIVNALILFVVAFVQFPTAVLAEFITGHDVRIAVQLYAIAYILIATVYRVVWGFACRHSLTAEDVDAITVRGVKRMYNLGVVHTLLAFAVSFWSLITSLLLFIPLFSIFIVPSVYSKLVGQLGRKRRSRIQEA